MNVAYNIDCMEYMKTIPDKYFDLAVVDPPLRQCKEVTEARKEIRKAINYMPKEVDNE